MRYLFGGCTLDPERRELHRDGRLRSVEPQVFDVLLYLLEHRDRVVGKDELIAAVWKGRVISDEALSSRLSVARAAVGDNGHDQEIIRTLSRRGFRFVAPVQQADGDTTGTLQRGEVATAPDPAAEHHIRFCQSADGTRIAHALSGVGQPLVKAGHWLTHVERDWISPVWRPLLLELGRFASLIRYDQRGNGLSDWDVGDFSLDACVADLEAVVDAVGVERFSLYGTSQGAPIAVTYAVRHPERVRRLILHGGFAQGRMRRGSTAEREQAEAYLTLMRYGWGMEGSQFIQSFGSLFIPDGTPEQLRAVAELQRCTTSGEIAVRLRRAIDDIDISELLPRVQVPTLVLHARNDAIHPLEQGRRLAAGIPGAEFRLLESRNHVILPQEPAWRDLLLGLRQFLAGTAA